MLVHPGHRHPLRSAGHQVDGILQQPDSVVDLVIDDHLIEVMSVGVLQRLRLLLQPLERLVLMGTDTQHQRDAAAAWHFRHAANDKTQRTRFCLSEALQDSSSVCVQSHSLHTSADSAILYLLQMPLLLLLIF